MSQDCIKNRKGAENRKEDKNCPLSLVDTIDPPQPSEGCDKNSWDTGFRQAIGGQHYLVRFADNPDESVRSFRACKSIDEKDGGNSLQCCISGFRKGLITLSSRFDEIKEKANQQSDEILRKSELEANGEQGALEHWRYPESLCAGARARGIEDAQLQCKFYLAQDGHTRELKSSTATKAECPKFKPLGNTYIGCYQLGFLQELMKCDCEKAKDARNLFEGLNKPSISNSVLPNKPTVPLGTSDPGTLKESGKAN